MSVRPQSLFSFAFFTISFGLIEAPSSQRSTCWIVMACFAAHRITPDKRRTDERTLASPVERREATSQEESTRDSWIPAWRRE